MKGGLHMPALSHLSIQSQLSCLFTFYSLIAHRLTRRRHSELWTFIDSYWFFCQWFVPSCFDMAANQSPCASVGASQIVSILCVVLSGLLARDCPFKHQLNSANKCDLFSCWAEIEFKRACLFLWSWTSLKITGLIYITETVRSKINMNG